ncbi:hypothetical protein ACS0TY_012861 [Phlomoides rotata]
MRQKDREIHFGNQTDHVPNFKYLDQLEKLKLTYDSGYFQWGTHALPRTLKKLSLVGSFFSWNDMFVIRLLPHLQVLKLRGFPNYNAPLQTWETANGEFPQLSFLLIVDPHLGDWITESSHFLRLDN